MRKLLLAGVAAAALTGVASSGAAAQDFGGGYAGVIGTVGMLNFTAPSYTYYGDYYGSVNANSFGYGIGAIAGFNFQVGNAVFGIEGDWSWSRLSATADAYDDEYYLATATWPWYATVRARAGVAVGNAFVYATGGILIAHPHYDNYYYDDMTPYSYDYQRDAMQIGLAAGAGAEMRIGQRMSVRAEYLYLGLPSLHTSTNGYDATFTTSAHVFRTGLTLYFGG